MTSRREPALAVWTRRALTIPVTFVLAALALLAAPLWGVLGLLWDALAGQARTLPRTRALAFFALYLGCEAAGLLAAFALWLVTLGGRLCGRERWVERNAALQRWWAGAIFHGSIRLFSMTVVVEGLDAPLNGPFLLFARHASMADTVLAAVLVAHPRKLRIRYVLKRELLRDPCLDVVGKRLPNAFVDRRGPDRKGEAAAIAGLAAGLDARSAVLIYPEGTRFSEPKRVAAVSALREKGRARLAEIATSFRNVLPPRLAGPLALLEEARGVDVVLLEHTGFEGASSFSSLWHGALVGGRLRVRFRRIPAASIPSEGRDLWLFERWAEVDRWISDARIAP